MGCERVQVPGGGSAIICGVRHRKCRCGRRATLECDWKVPGRRSGTCDRPLCPRCSFSPAPGKDLCLDHREAFEQWKASR